LKEPGREVEIWQRDIAGGFVGRREVSRSWGFAF
jgi:hypothetical protein